MDTVYLPVYKTAVGYTVTYGRRWSVLEQLILIEVARSKRSISDLVELCNLPDRLVVEAVINLLRTAWVEVRASEKGPIFAATRTGAKYADDKMLPAELTRRVKGASLCVDRVSNEWFRSEDLNLVNAKDIPGDATILAAEDLVPDLNDPSIRNLLYLSSDENLEPIPLNFRSFSNSFARIEVGFGVVQSGLPRGSLALVQKIFSSIKPGVDSPGTEAVAAPSLLVDGDAEALAFDDIIVGGEEHREFVISCLRAARTHLIIHSCFVSPKTIEFLLPHFAEAAQRRVRVDLLWGWVNDPEEPKIRRKISESEAILDQLDQRLRKRVQFASSSTGSHAKIMAWDSKIRPSWCCAVSSCNFLSSEFDWTEASVVLRNQSTVRSIVSNVLSWLLPASDQWSPLARRVHRSWQSIDASDGLRGENPTHRTKIIRDRDHYSAITMARDFAQRNIVVGCDLYGLSAEISVLVPMEAAAAAGKQVQLIFSRPSKFLIQEGREPNVDEIIERGLGICRADRFHAKFILFDSNNLIVSSFNWMSTVGKDARARGAEIGVCIEGPGIADLFLRKLKKADASSVSWLASTDSSSGT